MTSRHRVFPLHFLLAGSILCFTACGDTKSQRSVEPLAPAGDIGLAAAQDQAGFYPLSTGNTWNYAGNVQIQTFTPDPGDVMDIETEATHEQTGVTDLGDQSYVVERQSLFEDGGSPFVNDIYFRQDKSGLYEAEIPFAATLTPLQSGRPVRSMPEGLAKSLPRAAVEKTWTELMGRRDLLLQRLGRGALRPSGGVFEITRLAYPLHPGAGWTIREDPFFSSTVEGRDNLDTPAGRFAAWRIRIDSEFFGPTDEVHVWYGRCGYIGHLYHLTGPVTDEGGQVIGTMVLDDTERLTGLSLVGQGGCGGE